MSRVVALELDSETLQALQSRARGWGVRIEAAEPTFDPDQLERGGTEVLVVGGVADPIRLAQRAHVSAPDVSVLLIASPDECAALTERLRFSVFVGSNVRCLARNPRDAMLEEIHSALERGRRRRDYQRTIASLNRQVAAAATGGRSAAAVLGRLLEVAPIGVMVVDEDGLIQAVNPRGEVLLGAAEAALTGRPLWSPFPPDAHDLLRSLLERFNGDPSAQPREIVSSGALRMEVTGSRLTGPQPGFLVLLSDVTERFELIAELEQANRRKDEFLAMLGHELRNPLAPIRTALELMRLRGDQGSQRERTIIERQVAHMVDLVDDLLDVSRITRGQLALHREPVEAEHFIREAIEMTGPLLEDRRHRVIVEVPERGLLVDGDPRRLAQVVANLLTNAAKYTPRGGRVQVSAAREDGEVVVRVKDDGRGIDPDVLPRIFDLFVQKAQELDRSSGGLGIGLSIVHSLVALHGGTVTAESSPGQGSEFTVRLPALDSPGERTLDPARQHDADPAAGPRRLRILVVDDNEDAALLLRELLSSLGHVVEVAHDGPTALVVAAELQPDLALLDIGLPVMDGYELARRLRGLPGLESVRLVAVTGYGAASDRERTRAAGFAEHLVKPIDVEVLQDAIARAGGPT